MIRRASRWLPSIAYSLILGAGLPGGCPPPPGPGNGGQDNTGPEKARHETIFTEIIPAGFEGPQSCLICHSDVARDLLQTAHWKWEGEVANIAGLAGTTHGKKDLFNNFCIAVPSNEGRCSQCHPSYGWKDNTFDFTSTANVDCMVCHDTTGTYRKHPTASGGGGAAALLKDGEVVTVDAAELQEVAYNVGRPTRGNCGQCHFYAGGGDNVKHGDMSSDLITPTRELDVHMGGRDFACQTCHTVENHGVAGMELHSVNEGGGPVSCTQCHSETRAHTEGGLIASILNVHTRRVACETCHIPRFARSKPTKVEWYWSEAGQAVDPIPTDRFGQPTYDKMKGRFVWAKNVRPVFRWFNGTWERMVINVSDTFTAAGTARDPVVLARPLGSPADPDAKIYPFKKMIGDQPADKVNKRLLVPHLFGKNPALGLEHPYWADYDWGLALAEGTAYAGQDYSGEYEFARTVMYLKVSHEIAPKEQALVCNDCHGVASFWEQIGIADPRPE